VGYQKNGVKLAEVQERKKAHLKAQAKRHGLRQFPKEESRLISRLSVRTSGTSGGGDCYRFALLVSRPQAFAALPRALLAAAPEL